MLKETIQIEEVAIIKEILKKCKKCGEDRKIIDFTKRNDLKSGYGNICKYCKQKISKD